jgi:hypothetical protein
VIRFLLIGFYAPAKGTFKTPNGDKPMAQVVETTPSEHMRRDLNLCINVFLGNERVTFGIQSSPNAGSGAESISLRVV